MVESIEPIFTLESSVLHPEVVRSETIVKYDRIIIIKFLWKIHIPCTNFCYVCSDFLHGDMCQGHATPFGHVTNHPNPCYQWKVMAPNFAYLPQRCAWVALLGHDHHVWSCLIKVTSEEGWPGNEIGQGHDKPLGHGQSQSMLPL